MKNQNPAIIIFSTFPDEKTASEMGKALVEMRLSACASIVPEIRSIYRWQEKICDEKEYLLILKTREDLIENVETEIKKRHPYEVPEIVSVKIDSISESYLNWLISETSRGK